MKYLALNVGGNEIECPPGLQWTCGGEGILERIIRTGIGVLFLLAIILTLVYLIYGGLDWVTSRGEKEKIANAKRKITFAIIGLVIVFLSYLIVFILENMFGVKGLIQ